MPIEKAKKYYTGKEGLRLNCAQSIIKAFEEQFNITGEEFKKFADYGKGNAPEGLCGAYCAAKYILERHHPEKAKEFEEFFKSAAGNTLKCKEIRSLRKLSCLGCVEKAAEFVNKQKAPR